MVGITDSNVKTVVSGSVISLDASQKRSYPGSGSMWSTLTTASISASLLNGAAFSAVSSSILFDGVDDLATILLGRQNKVWTMISYVICNTSELVYVNFSQILEDGVDTVRKSVDGTKAILKYDGDLMPPTIVDLVSRTGPYSQQEIYGILSTPEWQPRLHDTP